MLSSEESQGKINMPFHFCKTGPQRWVGKGRLQESCGQIARLSVRGCCGQYDFISWLEAENARFIMHKDNVLLCNCLFYITLAFLKLSAPNTSVSALFFPASLILEMQILAAKLFYSQKKVC